MKFPNINEFIKSTNLPILPIIENYTPWDAINRIKFIIKNILEKLDVSEYDIKNYQVIHKSAVIEDNVQLKDTMIIGPNSFIANGCLLRGGVILDTNCVVGHGSEVKSSILFSSSRIAHLNFIGDSIIGNDVNIEGGAVLANHRNELTDKTIEVVYRGQKISTNVSKFGAIIGDHSNIGANAVLAPGTLLPIKSIIKRGASIDQLFD